MSVQFFLSEEGITASVNGGPEKVVLRVGITEDAALLRSMTLENEAGDPIFKYDEADGNVHYPWIVGGPGPSTDLSGYGAGGFRIAWSGEDLDIALNPGAGDPADWNSGEAIAASIQAAIRGAAAPGGMFENAVVTFDSNYKINGSLMQIALLGCPETEEAGEDFANLMKLQDPDYMCAMPGASQFQELRAGNFMLLSQIYRALSYKFGANRDNEKIWFVDVDNGSDDDWDSGSMFNPYEKIQSCFDRIASEGMANDIVCILGGHYEERIVFSMASLGGITVIGVNCDGRDVRIGRDSDPGNQAFTLQGVQVGFGRETYFKNLRFMNNHGDPGTDAFYWNGVPSADVRFQDCYFENNGGEIGTAHAFNFQDVGGFDEDLVFERCEFDGPINLHQDAELEADPEIWFKHSDCRDADLYVDLQTGGLVGVTSDVEFDGLDFNASNVGVVVPMGGVHPGMFVTEPFTVTEDTPIPVRLARLIPIEGDASLLPTSYVPRTVGIADGRFAGEMIYLAHAGGDPIQFDAASGLNVVKGGLDGIAPEDVILNGNVLGLMWHPTGEDAGVWMVMFDSKENDTGPRLMARVSGIDLTTLGTTFIFQTDSMKKWIKHHAVLVIEEADSANGDAEVRCGFVPNNNEVFGDTTLAMTDADDTWFWQLAPVIAQGGGRKLVVGEDYFGSGVDIQLEVISGDTTAVTLTATLYLFGEYVDQALMPV